MECLIVTGAAVLGAINAVVFLETWSHDLGVLCYSLVSTAITAIIYGPKELTDIPKRIVASICRSCGRQGNTHASTAGNNTSQHSIVPVGVGSDPTPET